MIMDAYGEGYSRPLNPTQVLGGPAWIRTDFYEINAKVNDSMVNGEWKNLPYDKRWDQAMLMLRSLLINRFKLRIERETKVLPVYELVSAKNGPKIAQDKTADRSCQITDIGPGKGLWLIVKSCDFSSFSGLLSVVPPLRSRVLVDKTGLHGRYSFKLHWIPEMPTSKPYGPSFFTALREQLGLRLEPSTAPVDTIVIEHIEKPTEN